MSDNEHAAKEFDAIKAVHAALAPLDDNARTRVLKYIVSLLGTSVQVDSQRHRKEDLSGEEEQATEDSGEAEIEGSTYSTFAELYDAAQPQTNSEKALVVGYWLQVCLRSDSFSAAVANKQLNHLGHKVPNITAAYEDLKEQKPALVLQLRKSGTSRQARKTYKLSLAGEKKVGEMIRG